MTAKKNEAEARDAPRDPASVPSGLRGVLRGGGLSAFAALLAASVYPFAAFVVANPGEPIRVSKLVLYGVATFVLGALVVVALALARPRLDPARIALSVAAVVAWFWNFSYVGSTTRAHGQTLVITLVVWAGLAVAIAVIVYRLTRPDAVRIGAVIFVCALTSVTVVQAVSTSDTPSTERPVEADVQPLNARSTPNIYFFVLDEYARNDQLESVLGFDNSEFYADLRDRGFTVSEDSISPYLTTTASISSVLSMDYVSTDGELLAGGLQALGRRMVDDNAVRKQLTATGYEFVFSGTGSFLWGRCDPDIATICIKPRPVGFAVDELDAALLARTPLGFLRSRGMLVTDPLYVVEQVQAHAAELEEPFFLFAHVLSPHPAWWYEADCSLRDTSFESTGRSTDAERAAYLQDLRCLNDLTLAAVDEIAATDPDAIIVVQADHGSHFISSREDEPSDAGIREQFAPLDAMKLPPGCEVPPGPRSTVNTFRIVFACLEGRPPELLPHRAFLWRWLDDENVVEIPPERLAPSGGDASG